LSVGALEERFWRTLCQSIGLPELIDDQLVVDRQPQLIAALDARFHERDRDDWVAHLGPLPTCVAPVLTPAEVLADEHLGARRLLREDGLAALLAGGDRDDVAARPDIWAELGLDETAVGELAAAGVIDRDER
jgi:crotonobetainyl-CoA:carnitine CoA-transferase CaiB-like acyl-CoA transferase